MASRFAAAIVSSAYPVVPTLAAWNHDIAAPNTDPGSWAPPIDASIGAARNPASANARSAVPTSGMISTTWPSKRGSLRSAARLWGAK